MVANSTKLAILLAILYVDGLNASRDLSNALQQEAVTGYSR